MTNLVDTSPETVNAEFDAAAEAIGVEKPSATENLAEANTMMEAEREAQIAIAQQMIATSLRLSLGLFSNIEVEKKYTDEAAHTYAVLIIKYFPGGIFGLLDKYKEELAAGTATIMLIKAVSQAKNKQQEEQEKEDQRATKKPPEESDSFTESEKGH